MKDLNFDTLYRITVFLVFLILLGFILIQGQGVIVPLIISFFIAFLLIPLVNFLERYKFSRVLASITAVSLAIVLVLALMTFFGAQIQNFGKDFSGISERVSDLIAQLPDGIQTFISGYSGENIVEFAKDNFGKIFSGVSGFISSFTFVFIVPIYIALILIYRDLLRNFTLKLFRNKNSFPANSNEKAASDSSIESMIPKIKDIIQKYILGMFYVICILFVLYSTALISLGIGHAILFAALAAVLNIIPYVGPFLGSGFPIIFALLTKDSLFYPIAVLASFVIIQTIEGNFLTPKIVGSNVSLNPFATLVTLMIGASIWGLAGMILFIPIVAILKEIFNAIDGMEPYAYVLGEGDRNDDGPNLLKKWYERVKNKLTSS